MAEAKKKDQSSTLRIENTNFGVKIIRSKGRVPDVLTGLYTSPAEAQRAINSFYKQGIR